MKKIHSKESLIAELKRYYGEFGNVPTSMEIKKAEDYPNPKIFQDYFGTWNNALEAAGFAKNKEYEAEYLLGEIQRFIAMYGHVPSTNEFRYNKEFPGIKPYSRIFGSFSNALIKLGLTPVQLQIKNRFSTAVLALDGHICDSAEEAFIDNLFTELGISHSIQPLYPRHPEFNPNGYKRADWLVNDVYVEYAGLINKKEYKAKLEAKFELATQVGIRLLIIKPSDLSRAREILSDTFKV